MTKNSRPASSRQVKALQKEFDVASSGRLFISVPGADLELAAHDSEKVIVHVYVDSLSENEALAIVERVKLRIRAIDNQTVRIESRSFYSDGFISWNSSQSLNIRLVVLLPATFNVDLQTAASDISIDGVDGRITVQGSGGSLKATNLKGKLEVYGYGCNMHVEHFNGSRVSLVGASGELQLSNIKANQISVRASSCTSIIRNLTGQTSLYLHSGRANVKAISGPLDVQSQSCEATFYIDEVDDTSLHVRGGELGLHIKQELPAKILLEGHTLYLDEALAFSGDKEPTRIEGALNKGKNLIHAQAAAAAIRCLSNK